MAFALFASTRRLIGFIWVLCLSIGMYPRSGFTHANQVHQILSKFGLPGFYEQQVMLYPEKAQQLAKEVEGWARQQKPADFQRLFPDSFDLFSWKLFLLLSETQSIYGFDKWAQTKGTPYSCKDVLTIASSHPDEDFRNRDRVAFTKIQKIIGRNLPKEQIHSNQEMHADSNTADLLAQHSLFWSAIHDNDGNVVPADPAILNMGNRTGLSSQAHAHYGLPKLDFSDDPNVLKSEPRRFAKKVGWPDGPLITLAAEMAQTHLDLALLAYVDEDDSSSASFFPQVGLGEGPGEFRTCFEPIGEKREDCPNEGIPLSQLAGKNSLRNALFCEYTGAAFHYLQDVGNPTHTVQVGFYDFFVSAMFERVKMGLLSGGGYFGHFRTLGSIGIDILTNHHTLAEEWVREQMDLFLARKSAPGPESLLKALSEEDEVFAQQLKSRFAKEKTPPEEGPFGQLIAEELINASSFDGALVYQTIFALANPKLRTRHVLFHEETDIPSDWIRKDASIEQINQFWQVQARAFRRIGTAMRMWAFLQQKWMEKAQDPLQKNLLQKQVLTRLVNRQLNLLQAQQERLVRYIAKPSLQSSDQDHDIMYLLIDIGLFLVVIGIGGFTIRWFKKRYTRRK